MTDVIPSAWVFLWGLKVLALVGVVGTIIALHERHVDRCE